MRTHRLAAAAAAVLLAAPAAARAQAAQPPAPAATAARAPSGRAPDYSGTWELNPTASVFGPMPAPSKMTMQIKQSGTALNVVNAATTAEGEQKTTNTFAIGGPAAPQDMGPMATATTAVAWDAAALVFKTTVQQQGMEIPVVTRWTMAPDGRQLTIDRQITTPMGEMSMKMVLDKK